MGVGAEGQGYNVDFFKYLYEKSVQVVWVIKIEGKLKGQPFMSYYTGFTATKEGHILTCVHGGWNRWSDTTIKVRRVDRSDVEFDAEIVRPKAKWDMCLLKVGLSNLEVNEYGKLASGKVNVGETVMVIGHPKEFVGSGIIGHAAYACTDKVQRDYDDFKTCYKFKSEALSHTPAYRVMGHIWHFDYFTAAEAEDNKLGIKVDRSFEKNLQPHLPIIQCSGFVGGVGTSGAPIFNVNGEIVGMLILESDGYQIGVHVSALKAFLEENIPSFKGEDTEVKSETKEESSKSLTKKMKT